MSTPEVDIEKKEESTSLASTETDVSCDSDDNNSAVDMEDDSSPESGEGGSSSNSSISSAADDDKVENRSSDESFSIYSENPELERMFQILLMDLWGNGDDYGEHDDDHDDAIKGDSHHSVSATQAKIALAELVSILDCNNESFGEKYAAFCQLDGHSTICRIMKRWRSEPSIQGNACQILALVSNREAFVVEYSTSFREMGGLESIILAMKNFPKHVALQRSGCCILSRLCCVAKNMDAAINQFSVIDLLTDAMITFPEDSEVQRWGCWALHTLSLWRKNRDAIVEAGGLGLLAYAIGSQPDAPNNEKKGGYREAARTTLTRLAKRKQTFSQMTAKRIKMDES